MRRTVRAKLVSGAGLPDATALSSRKSRTEHLFGGAAKALVQH